MSTNYANNPSDILVNTVTELLIGKSSAQRAEAARNLGRTGNRIAATYLIQGLSDRSPEVRLAAVEVLADLGDSRAIGPLSQLLDTETSPLVDRSVIIEALAALRRTNSSVVPSSEVTPLELVSTSAPSTLITPLEPVSSSPIDMDTSDDIQADDPQAHNLVKSIEVWPAQEAAIETPHLPDAVSLDPVRQDEGESLAESNEASSRADEELLHLATEAESILETPPYLPEAVSADPLVLGDEGELMADSYRHAAAERQLLEEARRRSNEEASRRAAEELFRKMKRFDWSYSGARKCLSKRRCWR